MRLALKFTLSFVLCMCVIVGVSSYFRVEREVGFFERDMRRDHSSLVRQLAHSTATVARASGEHAAYAFLDEVHQRHTRLVIRWVWLDPHPEEPDEPHLAPQMADAVRTSAEPVFEQRKVNGDARLFTYLAVPGVGRYAGAIEMSESLADKANYVRMSVIRAAITTLITILCTAAVAVILGAFLVGRPINALIGQARRVAAGDLSSRLHFSRRDELTDLARELNTMCETLVEARERVAAETAARQKAAEQLRQAERLTVVGKLASNVAHEMGTPLNVVMTRAKMILNHEIAGPALDDNARIIVDQTAKMTGAIRQLLDFARRRPSSRTPLDVRNVARQTVTLLAPTAQQRNITLRISTGDEPAVASVDSDQLHQVLSNLIANAINAMPEGGEVNLHVDRSPRRRPDNDGAPAEPTVCIHVRDSGMGIPEENRRLVFEPFFTSRGGAGGTGLGLSICTDIVEDHGGWIELESTLGVGTTFVVCLPAQEVV